MKRIVALAVTSLCALLGAGCAGPYRTFYEGTFKGMPYRLEEQETKGPSTASFTHRVKLGNLPSAEISTATTDWGPPYTPEIFGTAEVRMLPGGPAYNNGRDTAAPNAGSVLYFPKSRFSAEEFAQYAAWMESEWPKIHARFGNRPLSAFPYLIGAVHGDREDFARVFRRKTDAGTFLLRVEPDGRVRYYKDATYSNDEYSGVSDKVEMPGPTLYLTVGKDAGLTRADLQAFKDADGKGVEEYFKVVDR